MAAAQSRAAPSAGHPALCTPLLAPWLEGLMCRFTLSSHPEGHYARGLNTQDTTGLSRGHSWLQASCEEFPRTEGSRLPPVERHSPPVPSQASRVTVSWNAWSDPVGSSSPPRERTPGCLGACLRSPRAASALILSPPARGVRGCSEGLPAALFSWPFCLGKSVPGQSPPLSWASQQLKIPP